MLRLEIFAFQQTKILFVVKETHAQLTLEEVRVLLHPASTGLGDECEERGTAWLLSVTKQNFPCLQVVDDVVEHDLTENIPLLHREWEKLQKYEHINI